MHNLPVLRVNKFFSLRNILRKSFYEVGRASGPCLHLVDSYPWCFRGVNQNHSTHMTPPDAKFSQISGGGSYKYKKFPLQILSPRFITWFKKTKQRFFFCGIWDDWAVNSAMTMILKTFGLWCLKKIQKNFFLIFMNFSQRYGTRKAKNPVFFKKTKKWGFFWRCNFQVFFGVFLGDAL